TLSISDQKLLIKKLKLAANLNHADALYQLGAYYRRENKKINRYGLEKYIKIFEQTLKIDPNHFKSKLRVGANLIVSNDNLELAQQYLFDVATEGIKQHRIATKALGILAYHFKILKSQFDKSKQNLDKLSTNLPITKNLDSIKEYSSEKKINEWCSHFIDYINLPIHAQIKTANENLYRDSKKFESLKQKLLCIYKQHIAEGIVSAYHSLANLIEYGYLDQISVEKTPFELHLTVANLGYFKSFLPVAWHYLENNDPKAIDWLNKIVEYDFDASSNQYKTDPSKCKLTKQDYEEDLRWAMEKLNDLNKEE
ncbi:MAG: hypothetical protein Q8K60_02700, partial [Parachlamydiaceae bacterium]|nr:hypothetical protein [Parachlamydiaceae bacterium]